MEVLPTTAAPSSALSCNERTRLSEALNGSKSAGPGSLEGPTAHAGTDTPPVMVRPPEAAPENPDGADEGKAVVSGVLLKSQTEKYCMLLGAYFFYGEPMRRSASTPSLSPPEGHGARYKKLLLSDVRAHFDSETCTIRLVKLKGYDARLSMIGAEKVFTARSDSDFYVWQAAITRAMALWPGRNAVRAGGPAQVSADCSPLGRMLQEVIRIMAYVTFATSVDLLSADDIAAGVYHLQSGGAAKGRRSHDRSRSNSERPRSLAVNDSAERQARVTGEDQGETNERTSERCGGDGEENGAAPRWVRLRGVELDTAETLTCEAYNCVLVNTLVQLPPLMHSTLEFFVATILEQHGKTVEAGEVRSQMGSLPTRLRQACEDFAAIALEYGYDIAAGTWPAPEAGGTPQRCVELLRLWIARSPTAPWSALLGLANRYLRPAVRALLGLDSQPRSCPNAPGLNGIRNLGNTCYLSAVLQCLAHTPQVTRFFLLNTQELYVGPDRDARRLATRMGHLMNCMWTSSRTLDVAPIANALIRYDNEAFKKGEQHDAHEALVALLDMLDSELRETVPRRAGAHGGSGSTTLRRRRLSSASSQPAEVLPDYTSAQLSEDELVSRWRAAYVREHNSFITHYFSGQVVQRFTCPSCGVSSYCCDSFTYLIVPVTGADRTTKDGRDGVTLEDCLESAFRPEKLEMTAGSRCEKCKRKMLEPQRTLELQRLPPYLLISVSRFEVNDEGKASSKADTPVFVPAQLSLGRWLRSAALLPILGEGGNVHFSQMDRSSGKRGGYELYGAVLHRGSINSGHYTAVCRVGTHWYEFNDSLVKRLPSSSTWLRECAKDFYLLFYRSTAGDL